jgi:hypothetical protein
MIGLDPARNIRSIQLRAFFLVTRVSSYVSLTPLGITDVPASRDGHLVNCCDSNLSQSGGLCLRRGHRTVRHNSISFFSALTVIDAVGLATMSASNLKEVVA